MDALQQGLQNPPRSRDGRTTLSYARYLYETHFEVKLGPAQVVDHIDNDPLHDEVSNLQVLSRTENNTKDHPGSLWVCLRCPHCGREFSRERRQTHLVKNTSFTCCSRSCLGKLSSGLQHGRLSLFSIQKGNVLYEFRKSFNTKS